MARTNYKYEKRQKDIAKKKKQEEKRLKKLSKSLNPDEQTEATGEETTADETDLGEPTPAENEAKPAEGEV